MNLNLAKTLGLTIILDMDGVLCDFATASIKACGLPMQHDDIKTWNFFEPYMTEEEYIRCINAVPGYWENLEPYPWTDKFKEVFNGLREDGSNILIMTNPGTFKGARRGKINWLINHGFIDNEEDAASRVIFGLQKWRLASEDSFLIDDSPIQATLFTLRNGKAICFPQPWNWDSSQWPLGVNSHYKSVKAHPTVQEARADMVQFIVDSFYEYETEEG